VGCDRCQVTPLVAWHRQAVLRHGVARPLVAQAPLTAPRPRVCTGTAVRGVGPRRDGKRAFVQDRESCVAAGVRGGCQRSPARLGPGGRGGLGSRPPVRGGALARRRPAPPEPRAPGPASRAPAPPAASALGPGPRTCSPEPFSPQGSSPAPRVRGLRQRRPPWVAASQRGIRSLGCMGRCRVREANSGHPSVTAPGPEEGPRCPHAQLA
jgi:hypothetical protein